MVSIITRAPESGIGGSVYADFGSFATSHGGASLEYAGAAGEFQLAASALSSGGISSADEANGNQEADGHESRSLAARGGLDLAGLAAGARLQTSFLATAAETDFDSYSFGVQGSIADGDEYSETEESAANVSLLLPSLDGRLEHLLLVGHSSIDRRNFSGGAGIFSAEGRRAVYRYQGRLSIGESNTLAFGAEREQTGAFDDEIAIDSLFAVHAFKPAAHVTLTGGLRSDRHERAGSGTDRQARRGCQSESESRLARKLGRRIQGADPVPVDLLSAAAPAHPTPGLKPESSSAFDAGFEWRAADGRAAFGLTIFNQSTENMINFAFAQGRYENIAIVDSTGAEFHGSIAIARSFRLNANYAFIDARDNAGNPLLQVPKHSGDLSLDYDGGGDFSGRLLLRHNGSEPSFGGGNVENWTRIDFTGRYQLAERVELFVRVENLLDETLPADSRLRHAPGAPAVSAPAGDSSKRMDLGRAAAAEAMRSGIAGDSGKRDGFRDALGGGRGNAQRPRWRFWNKGWMLRLRAE